MKFLRCYVNGMLFMFTAGLFTQGFVDSGMTHFTGSILGLLLVICCVFIGFILEELV